MESFKNPVTSYLLRSQKLPYTDVAGLCSVREIVAKFINLFYQTSSCFTPFTAESKHIVITAGAVQAVYNTLALSIEDKDDVIVTTLPAYGLYKHQTELLGGTFYAMETEKENNFVPTIKNLQTVFEKFTENSKLKIRSLVLCFPNNPAGANLTEQQAKEIAKFLDEMLVKFPEPGFSVILDEVYLGISETSVDQHKSVLTYASPRLLNSIFLILSASKGKN